MKKAVIILTIALIISLAGNVFQFVYTSALTSKLSAEKEKTAELSSTVENLKSEIEKIREDVKKAQQAAENEQKRTAELEATVESLTAEIKELKWLNATLGDLTEEQIAYFSSTAKLYVQDVLNGDITLSECEDQQNSIIEVFMMENELPQNGIKLFGDWKEENNWYKQFEGLIDTQTQTPADGDNTTTQQQPSDNQGNTQQGNQGTQGSQQGQNQSGNTQTDKDNTDSKPASHPETTSNKPKPSKEQEDEAQQQQQEQSSSGSKEWNEMTQEERDAILNEAYEQGGGGGTSDDELAGDELPDWAKP